MSMQSAVDQVVFNKTSTKASKKAVVEKDPKVAPLVTFLNGVTTKARRDTRAPAFTLRNPGKDISFKDLSKRKNEAEFARKKAVIDLNKFAGIEEIKNAYSVISKFNASTEGEEKLSTDGITNMIYDPILRGYASMAEIRFVEKKKRASKPAEDIEEPAEDTEEPAEEPVEEDAVVSEHLNKAIGSLQLPAARSYGPADFINAIHDVVRDEKTFKIKAYNRSFPLPGQKGEKESGLASNRCITKWHVHCDDVLKFICENITAFDEDELRYECLRLVHGKLYEKYAAEHSNTSHENIAKCIQFASFLHRFNREPEELIKLLTAYIPHKKGVNDEINEMTIRKAVKAWPMYVETGNKKAPFGVEESVTLQQHGLADDIIELISKLRQYLTFINNVLKGKTDAEESTKSVLNYSEFYKRFTTLMQQHTDFVEAHDEVTEDVESLLVYLVQAIVFISRFKNAETKTYEHPKIFDNSNIKFSFNLKLGKALKEIYTLPEAKIEKAVRDLIKKNYEGSVDLSLIGPIETLKATDAENADIFAKIGMIANTIPGINIDKNLRIGIGLYIVKSVILETEKILAQESRKASALEIYLKI